MKGLILAGGAGSRLFPNTSVVSKQLLPIYDKPMIYYPLSVLMLAGIHDILLITTPHDRSNFERLLGNGSQWGIRISYVSQPRPEGLVQAFILGRDFIDGDSCTLLLGDNIFYGHSLGEFVAKSIAIKSGGVIFTSPVNNPSDYGVVTVDGNGQALTVEEKPKHPRSNLAITGLYAFDSRVVEVAETIRPSARGETEITDVIRDYMDRGELKVKEFGRGVAWLDTGTHDSMLEASQFVATLSHRQGLKIACLEEIAFNKGLIDEQQLLALAENIKQSSYGQYLMRLVPGKL